jgi:hypothetical protein
MSFYPAFDDPRGPLRCTRTLPTAEQLEKGSRQRKLFARLGRSARKLKQRAHQKNSFPFGAQKVVSNEGEQSFAKAFGG